MAWSSASPAYAMLNQIAVERMNSLYLDLRHGRTVPPLCLRRRCRSKPDDLKGLRFRSQPVQRDLQRYGIAGEHRGAGGLPALERGVRATAGRSGHQRFRLGQELTKMLRIDQGSTTVVNILMNKTITIRSPRAIG
jgi:hypothetical protein